MLAWHWTRACMALSLTLPGKARQSPSRLNFDRRNSYDQLCQAKPIASQQTTSANVMNNGHFKRENAKGEHEDGRTEWAV